MSETVITPRVEALSSLKDDLLKFTLSNVDVSIANSIRRVILSDIPIIVFRVSPNDKNKCTIIANTCGLNNEIVKHRLSCIPIHIKDIDDFPLKNYVMELNVQNNTDTNMIVTTKDFVIKDLVSGKPLSEDALREIFPANALTGDYIDFVKLRAKTSEEIKGKSIHLICEFDIGTAKEDSAFNVVSTCSYGNTIDVPAQESKLQQLKQKWKDEGKTEHEIEFEEKNWKLLEGRRIFVKDSFDFSIQTIGIHTNCELLVLATKIMLQKLEHLDTIIEKDNLEIKVADNTMQNCFDIILDDQDYTLGKVIEYFFLVHFYENKTLTFCGFKMMHPHDGFGVMRVAYSSAVDIPYIKGNLQHCISKAKDVYMKLNKEFLKLVPP